MEREIWTIGHSTREWSAFLGLLEESRVGLVADVRRFPGSIRHPQYQREALATALGKAGIAYRHFGGLGGRRSARAADSPNTGWRVEAFNAYADYMATTPFQDALSALIAAASESRTAVMCAEAVPWRCHRRLIADALIVRGWAVWDIVGPKRVARHALTDFARVRETSLVYPSEPLFPEASG